MTKKPGLFAFLALFLVLSWTDLQAQQITTTEQDDLLLMREEEKLARDVYAVLGRLWELPVFTTIAESEQRHMDAVLGLLNFYGLSDPAADNPDGVFQNAELQELYHNAVEYGQQSSLAALEVGVYIEETDIKDLEAAVGRTDRYNIERVYSNLLKGSTNHLAAFTNNLEAAGGSYQGNSTLPGTAVYEPLSQTLYVPAIDVMIEEGEVVVVDALLRLVETFPQALEVVYVGDVSKLPSPTHSSFSFITGDLIIPDLVVGSVRLGQLDGTHYTATLRLVEAEDIGPTFVVVSIEAK